MYILEIVAFAGFLLTRPHWTLVVSSAAIITTGFFFFSWLSKAGKRLLAKETDEAAFSGNNKTQTTPIMVEGRDGEKPSIGNGIVGPVSY